jgi:uncharacterized protein
MLLLEIPRIPPEGLDVHESLSPSRVHVEGDDELTLDTGELAGHVEIVDENTVHVQGTLTAGVHVQCGRCLEPYALSVDQKLDLFYLPRLSDRPQDEEEDVELDDHDIVVGYYEGETLDLGEVVREQLLLFLPMKRLCGPDCKGLCPTCGRNRNSGSCSCPEPKEPVDPRLEPLRKLVGPDRH